MNSLFLPALADAASWALLAAGAALTITGSLGFLRLPDFYSRLHAAGLTDTLGAVLILLSFLLQTETAGPAARIILMILAAAVAGPTAAHAMANAAWNAGLKPFVKKQNNPNP